MSLRAALVGSSDRQLAELLRAGGMHVTSMDVAGLSALASPSASQPDLIVLDSRDINGLPPAVATIKRHHPETGVVIVAASLAPAFLLEAMRAGVTEVVSDPVDPADLTEAIHRVSRKQPVAKSGQLFGFVGAKGGVGATTVAVNIATALGQISQPGRTLIADVHPAAGDVAVFTSAEPRFSMANALENTHRLDHVLLRNFVVQVAPNVDLLASPDRAIGAPVNPSHIRTVLDFLGTAYKYVVLDLPRADQAILDSLDSLTLIVVVINQELATVKNAARLAAMLRHRYGQEKLKIVLSRSDRHADIGPEDIERALGCRVAHTFPSEYRLALNALNKGRPIALDNHNELSASFRRFALELAGVGPDRDSSGRTGLFGLRGSRR